MKFHKRQPLDREAIVTGTRVYWVDPDNGLASGHGTVISTHDEPIDDDTVIQLRMDDEGEAEVFAHELFTPDDDKKWRSE